MTTRSCRALLALCVLSLVACDEKKQATPATPATPIAPANTTSQTTPAAKTTGSGAVKAPVKAAPKATLTKAQALAALCPEASRDGAKCAVCPKVTVGETLQGVKLPEGGFSITMARVGSYTRAGAVEAWVGIDGCTHFPGDPSGAVLLRSEGGAWKPVAHATAAPTSSCKFAPSKGREVPVCIAVFARQGHEQEQVVTFALDGGKLKRVKLKEFESNSASCMGQDVEDHEVKLGAVSEGAVEVLDAWVKVKLPAQYSDLCSAQEKGYKLPKRQQSKHTLTL